MKQKFAFAEFVTKEFLLNALKKFATKTELKNVEKLLRKLIFSIEVRIENLKEYMDKRFDQVDKRFDQQDEKFREYRDEIMTRLDYLIGKYEDTQQDQLIGTHQIRELRESTDNHEKRIGILEHDFQKN